MRTPKQLLNITGHETMLRATLRRLQPVLGLKNFWAITNVEQAAAVRREMRGVPASHILAEPLGRNTATAIGLAAIHLAHERSDAVMAVLPSDSYIAETARYRKLVRAAIQLAEASGNLVVMGIPPTRPETGYGYVERGGFCARSLGISAFDVRRFTEKPALPLAKRYVASRRYFWNAGMFFWRVSTFLEALKQFLPATHNALIELKRFIGTSQYPTQLRRTYARLESISVDYAVMEPATRMKSAFRAVVIPANVGWSDIGSWAAVFRAGRFTRSMPAEIISGARRNL
jgi:mannose-1-phosphate guanylyltransferase